MQVKSGEGSKHGVMKLYHEEQWGVEAWGHSWGG